MRVLSLALLTFRELILKATIVVLAAISTLILLAMVLGTSVEHTPQGVVLSVFGQRSEVATQDMVEQFVRAMEASSTGGLFFGVVLFGVIATAGVMPDILQKGTIDLYLSKPLSRIELLGGRVLGSLLAIAANILYFLGGLWLATGLRLSTWHVMLLVGAAGMTVAYATLYALTTFLGTISRSAVLAIIGTFLFQVIAGPLLENRAAIAPLIGNGVAMSVLDVAYYAFPQVSAMQRVVVELIMGASVENAWRPFATSLAAGLGWYALAWWWMHRSDY